MNLHPIFKLREHATEEIIQLLESVTLGTDGAHYRHLDTRERINEADNPLFLTIERTENKPIGNITFCQREGAWYIRYFAFDQMMQAGGEKKSANREGLLRRELNKMFDSVLERKDVNSFYAYIDPKNAKSLWMSENFGFTTMATIRTQTFSRVKPKASKRVSKTMEWNEVKELIRERYKDYQYSYFTHTEKGPFYVLKDDAGEIIACMKYSIAKWQIKRLPGKLGGFTTKLIPYIPFINRLIKPDAHTFMVPEAVVVKDNDPHRLNELYEGALASEHLNLMIWWVDEKDELYQSIQPKMKWGLLDKIIGASEAKVVVKTNKPIVDAPVYTIGFDFI